MPRTVYTTTISLPKSMARDIKMMTKNEGRTVSELIREAIRLYQIQHYNQQQEISWEELQAKLERVSRYGRQIDSTKFLQQDRLSH